MANNRALQIAKKNHLYSLIKKVGIYYGEDIDFLREYAKEVYENNNLDDAIACFEDLARLCVEKTVVKVFDPEENQKLKYQPPFCDH